MMSHFDFHIHSKYSFDSMLSPEQILLTSIKKKLDGVCVCDHGSIKGALQLKKIKSDDFIVVVGSEISTEHGDIIALFLNENIKSTNFNLVVDEIEAQDGIVVLAHPFRNENANIPANVIKRIKLIEGYNSRTVNVGNQKAMELALKKNKPIIGGSDAHFANEIGLAKTIFDDVYSEEDIRKLLLKGKAHICGSQTPIFYIGLSKMLGNIRERKWKRLAYNSIKMPIKYVKYKKY